MSFILDALKKSETERQQQAGTEFATVPTRTPAPRRNLWLWLLVLLLVVNLAVLLGILVRPPSDAPAVAAQETAYSPEAAPAATPERVQDDFATRLANARRSLPAEQAAAETVARTGPAPDADSGPPAGGVVAETVAAARIPTIDELRLAGLIDLPELRIDIHVYSDNPAERFVFINMNKQREESLLPAGPVVKEIRPDGVVLEHGGRIFLLPRE